MIQRFIELGEGYSDLYELLEIGKNNQHRVMRLLAMHSTFDEKPVTSLAIVLKPTDPGDFQPIYMCREGIPNPNVTPNKRYELFRNLSSELEMPIVQLDVKSSRYFADPDLFHQYLIGILRLNHLIPPMK
ncbi:DUF7147 family protein [Peribacillus acanthi]|uniref:DUF7147 family protein n=1 Tax=Peribacillus acanthi TaxID=2171554 RepID=UPI000D3E413B|nr:methylthioribose kinase [Peribacillus acanthi]